MKDLDHLPEEHDDFEHLDEDQVERIKTKLQEHQQQKEDADEDNYKKYSSLMRNTVDNLDESVGTIYTHKQGIEKKIVKFRNRHERLEDMEKHDDLTELELKKKWKQLSVHLQEIIELLATEVDVQDVRVEMLEDILEQIEEKKYDKETATDMIKMFNENQSQLEDIIDDRIQGVKDSVESRVDAEVSKQTAKMSERVGMLQRDVKRSWDMLETSQEVMKTQSQKLDSLAEKIEQIDAADNEKLQQVAEEVQSQSRDLQQKSEQLNREKRESDALEKKKDYPSVEENSEEDSSESSEAPADEDIKEKVQEQTSDSPRYKLKEQPLNNIREELEQIEKDFESGDLYPDKDSLSLRSLAEVCDVTRPIVKKKIKTVNEDFSDEEWFEQVLEELVN